MKKLNTVWKGIDWMRIEKIVFKLQYKINLAFKEKRYVDGVRLQKRMLKSHHAKCLAVHLVAEVSKGRHTAGPDGVCSGKKTPKKDRRKLKKLTKSILKKMVNDLSLQHSPSPVKRIEIDKPGSTEKRGLGIPNIEDRVHQALVNLALYPEWEAKFSPHQYGFRKGRSTHDAIVYLRRCINRQPKFVAECDIEKFFDLIDHEALIKMMATFPEMEKAIRRILKSGALQGTLFIPGEKGTPQGGVISPILANIVMAVLEAYIKSEFKQQRQVIGTKSYTPPHVIIYADDLVILHKELAVVQWAQEAVSKYIASFGLNLNLNKTRVCHTLNAFGDQSPGVNFLGVTIRQYVVGKYSPKPFGMSIHTSIKPSKEAKKRFRQKVSEIIKKTILSGKRSEARRNEARQRNTEEVTDMIQQLNWLITGWANYYRYYNSKEVFADLDHYIHERLWAWAIRQFPKKNREWIIDHMFSGVESDGKGQPLKRLDGELRERKWAFMSPFVCKEKSHKTVKKLADTQIKRHTLVIGEKSIFDRDWAYWATRQGRHPLIPKSIAKLMKGQGGKCYSCKGAIKIGDRITVNANCKRVKPAKVLLHDECMSAHSSLSEGVYV